MKKNLDHVRKYGFHPGIKLLNVIKFVVLSAALSDTCLFAVRMSYIDIGFKEKDCEDIPGMPLLLCCDLTCYDYDFPKKVLERMVYNRAGVTFYIWPLDENGKGVDWRAFTESFKAGRASAPKVPEDKPRIEEEETGQKYYRCFFFQDCNSQFDDCKCGYFKQPFNFNNNADGFCIRCAGFCIRLDKHGILHLSGGGREEHLVLARPGLKQGTIHELPLVIDDKEVLSCDTLVIENFKTFTNKGTIKSDSLIWRHIMNAENEGKISVRNLILDNCRPKGEGDIQWNDNFDLYRNGDISSYNGKIVQGKKTGWSFKMEPKIKAEGSDGFGSWLLWDDLKEGKGIKFPPLSRRVMLHLIGEFVSDGPFEVDFSEKTEWSPFRKKEMSEGFVSRIAVRDRREEQLYVGLFGHYDVLKGLRRVHFEPKKAYLYVIFGSEEGDESFDTTKDTSAIGVSKKKHKKHKKHK